MSDRRQPDATKITGGPWREDEEWAPDAGTVEASERRSQIRGAAVDRLQQVRQVAERRQRAGIGHGQRSLRADENSVAVRTVQCGVPERHRANGVENNVVAGGGGRRTTILQNGRVGVDEIRCGCAHAR